MVGLIVTGVIFAVLIFYFIGIYNALIEIRENVKRAESNIDVLLKQRSEELPKLVEVCRQYMKHEEQTLNRVMLARQGVDTARNDLDIRALSAAETEMRASYNNLLAVAESYPELKAQSLFSQLAERISDLQNAISDRREFYNEQATINNITIEQFPAVIVARWFRFVQVDLLKFQENELKDVNIGALFGQA